MYILSLYILNFSFDKDTPYIDQSCQHINLVLKNL